MDEFIISQFDTVLIPELRHDTLLKITPGGSDTFFISKTNTTIIHNAGTLGVSTQRPQDTIFLTRQYYTKEPKAQDKKFIYLGLSILAILVLFLMGMIIEIKKT